uniref:Lipoyl-binding domain-containing protein n=1 Tax=Dunaliella tertiolecta TaxID=3047 RepID=A0A7S3R2U8_DUNTE|eukprot:CAMPEP_0202380834 /NCGR_PEP_ID=MMETSP1127-20130417/31545_1 /ASSEMBLY_ACC=CAM_ASM_000462 /TAXON_ID=3047 /ORGANISM="Dunaliella tertiolecta, Strain CCMP1320" /LENGTH=211 /DNA_ID=CAMNT_0048979633 /DNA_START=8 /DNA_END=643 /DNA_ORIENTATION=+
MIASCGKALAATARAGMRLSSAGGVPSSNTHQFLQAATSQSSSQQQQQQQHNHTQQASDASDEVPQQPPGVHVVPFPQLSPPMHTGRLTKWLKQPGDRVELYDVLFEVDTEELTEELYRVGQFEGTTQLLVESHEEGWLAKHFVEADGKRPLQVGTPVGVLCEEEGQVASLQHYSCPTTNVYDTKQPQVQTLPWQSFLKSGEGKSSNCCMG